MRCVVFFASDEDASNWVEILYLLPTTAQFAGFGLWVLYFAYLTGSSLLPALLAGTEGVNLELNGRDSVPVSSAVDVVGGLRLLAGADGGIGGGGGVAM